MFLRVVGYRSYYRKFQARFTHIDFISDRNTFYCLRRLPNYKSRSKTLFSSPFRFLSRVRYRVHIGIII